MADRVTFEMIEEARKRMEGVARCTPIISAKKISENIFFKAENLQKTGSFKIRGAYNKICSLTDDELKKGVIACSAGNHAQGVALAATKRGARSIICMPESAPLAKIEATAGYGGEVLTVKGNYDDAAKEAVKLRDEKGYVFVHPFDDPYVIAGQGTIGLEILEQMPDVEQVVVPIGGGGLISGLALAIKTLKPECKVIGVQSSSVASMYGSLKVNHIITIPDATTVADGLHVLTPGELTFNMVKKYVDDIVTVEEDEIYVAIAKLMDGPKIVAEGAGATPMAAYLFNKIDPSLKTVCLVSGGNLDLIVLKKALDKVLNSK